LPSEESEDEVSDFDDSDTPKSKKKQKTKKDPAAVEEVEEAVTIPMGTKEFEKILDYRKNPETGKEELLVKYKVSIVYMVWKSFFFLVFGPIN
jgi:hypothetical protein